MCDIDYAEPDYLRRHHNQPVAAWPVPCSDCGRTIAAGERYDRAEWSEWEPVTGTCDTFSFGPGWESRVRWTGDTYVTRMCLHCLTAGRWLDEVCGGYFHGAATDEIASHWHEELGAEDYRCPSLARLILASRGWPRTRPLDHVHANPRTGPWQRLVGGLIPLAVIDGLVDRALASYDRQREASLQAFLAAGPDERFELSARGHFARLRS